MSTLRRFNLGVILALAAWLVQLSVFLTPILSSQIGIGYGVCDELAAFVPLTDTSHAQHPATAIAPMPEMDMSGMDMAAMASMPEMASSSRAHAAATLIPAKTDPVHTHADSHHGHALCGFCLLFGHSVLPPTVIGAALLLPTLLQRSASRIADYASRAIPASKVHHPQGRAPPQPIVLL